MPMRKEMWEYPRNEDTVVFAAHDIVVQYRYRSWAECERALENMKLVVDMLDKEWVQTEGESEGAQPWLKPGQRRHEIER